jgi:hypothetical protein
MTKGLASRGVSVVVHEKIDGVTGSEAQNKKRNRANPEENKGGRGESRKNASKLTHS